MDTFLVKGNTIWHRITSSTTSGGSIETTTEGNTAYDEGSQTYDSDKYGKLNDGGTIVRPSQPYETYSAVVPDGKYVTYTMKPEKNFGISTLTIDGVNVPVDNLTQGAKTDVAMQNGGTGRLTYTNEGTYLFEFPANNKDHTIDVAWAPDFTFYKTWAGSNRPDDNTELTLVATPYVWDSANSTFVRATKIGSVGNAVEVPAVTFRVKGSDVEVTRIENGDTLTTWRIKYPGTGADHDKDGYFDGTYDWAPLPFEDAVVTRDSSTNVITKVDITKYHWFVTEENVSTGWIFGEYSNSDAVASDVYGNAKPDNSALSKVNTGAYMGVYDTDKKAENQGGRIGNVQPVIVKGQKTWDDYTNAYDTREDIVLHLDVDLSDSSDRTAYYGKLKETKDKKLVGEDVLPPIKLEKNSNSDTGTVTWGEFETHTESDGTTKLVGKEYTGADGTKAYPTMADAVAALGGHPYDNTFMSQIFVDTEDPTKDTVTFANMLPAYDVDGVEYKYQIRETDTTGNNAIVYSADSNASDPESPLVGYTTELKEIVSSTKDANGLETRTYGVTNTLATTEITVTKKWVDGGKSHDAQELLNGFRIFRVVGGTPLDVTDQYLDADDNGRKKSKNYKEDMPYVTVKESGSSWKYEAKHLPEYVDRNGTVQKATYYIQEQGSDGAGTSSATIPIADGYMLPRYSNGTFLQDVKAAVDGINAYANNTESSDLTGEGALDAGLDAMKQSRESRPSDRALDGGTITNVALPTGEVEIPVVKELTGATTIGEWNGGFTFILKSGSGVSLGDNYKVKISKGSLGAWNGSLGSISEPTKFPALKLKAFVEDGDTVIYAVGNNDERLSGVSALCTLSNPSGNSAGSGSATLRISEDAVTGLVIPADQVVTLNISDKGDGTLAVTVEPATGMTMHNIHEPAAATPEIKVEKTMTGRDLLASDNFTFTARYVPDYASTRLDQGQFEQVASVDPAVVEAVLQMSDSQLVYLNDLANGTDGAAGADGPALLARIRAGHDTELDDNLERFARMFTDDQIRQALLNTSDSFKAMVRGANADVLRNQLRLLAGAKAAVDNPPTTGLTIDSGNANKGTGAISLSLTKMGTYKFEVTENIPDDAVNDSGVKYADATEEQKKAGGFAKNGVTYASTTHTVTVTVVKDVDGNLKATTAYDSNGDSAKFANTYKASGTLHLGARKNLVGKQWDDDMRFDMTIAKVESAPDFTGDSTQTIWNNTPDHQVLWDIEFNSADIGKTYTYTIKEETPSYGAFKKEDWSTLDSETNAAGHTVTVKVTDPNNDGTLKLEVLDGATPLNSYSDDVLGTVYYERITNHGQGVDIRAAKVMVDGIWPGGKTFGLLLTPKAGYSKSSNGADFTASETSDVVAPMPLGDDNQPVSSTTRTATRDDHLELVLETISNDSYDTNKEPYSSMNNGDAVRFTYTISEDIPADAKNSNGVAYSDATNEVKATGGFSKAGVTYDSKTYEAYLTITKNNGIYTPTVTYNITDTEKPTFTNSYASKGEVTIKGTKALIGRSLSNYEKGVDSGSTTFTFTLQDENGGKVKDANGNDIADIAAKTNGTIELPAISYTQVDTQGSSQPTTVTYYLVEDVPEDAVNAAGTKYSEATPAVKEAGGFSLNGVTYDSARHPITVTLTDKGDGTIETSFTPKQEITNTYDATATQTFTVEKTLSGRPITRDGFSFQIEALKGLTWNAADSNLSVDTFGTSAEDIAAKVDVPMPEEHTVSVSADTHSYSNKGTAAFGPITYTNDNLGDEASKTYYYQVSEIVPTGSDANGAITYTPVTYYIEVKLSDGGEGALTREVTVYKKTITDEGATYETIDASGNSYQFDFTNEYKADGAATLAPVKQVNGRDWAEGDSFTFKIEPYSTDDVYSWTGTKSDGKVEDKKVPLPGNSTEASRGLVDTSGSATGAATYTSTAPLPAQRSSAYSATNTGGFSPITFAEGMLKANESGVLEGDFYYKITEDTTGLEGKGFTQTEGPTKTYYARVHVTDDRFGNLNTTVHYYTSEADVKSNVESHTVPVFQNTYTAKGTTAAISATKHIEGRTWTAGDEFNFTLSPVGGDMPMPEGAASTATLKLSGTGNAGQNDDVSSSYSNIAISFDNLTGTARANQFEYSDSTAAAPKPVAAGTKYGVFTYQIAEDASAPISGLTYATEPIYVRVVAIDKLDGNIDCQVSYYRDSAFANRIDVTTGSGEDAVATPATSAVFTNTYREILDIPVKKDVNDEKVWTSLPTGETGFNFTITATGENAASAPLPTDIVITATKDNVATTDVDESQPSFEGLTFTLDDAGKTYTYTIAETKVVETDIGKAQLVRYDETPITATFYVDKDEHGNLRVTPAYTKGGESVNADKLSFTNMYIQNDTAKLYVYKRVVGGAWREGETFTFDVAALDGAHAPKYSSIEVKNSTAHHEAEDDVTITADDFGDVVGTDGVKSKDFIYRISENLTDTQKNEYAGSDPIYAKVTATFSEAEGVKIASVTYWHTYEDGEVSNPAVVVDTSGNTLVTNNDGTLANDGDSGTVAVQMTNWNNKPADAPAQFIIQKEVVNANNREYTWADGDKFDFSVTPIGAAPAISGDSLQIGKETSATVDGFSGDNAHAISVGLPIKLSDLNRDAQDNPVTTKFYYEIREQAGSHYGMSYATDPLYLEVTASYDVNDPGKLPLTYKVYKSLGIGETDEVDASAIAPSPEDDITDSLPVGWPEKYGYVKFTNEYGVTDLQVDKEWWDGSNTGNTRPERLTFSLAATDANGNDIDLADLQLEGNVTYNVGTSETSEATAFNPDGNSITVETASGGIKSTVLTFQNLPVATASGSKITYSVVEGPVDNYTTSYSSENEDGKQVVTVTNKLQTDVKVTKVWNDNGNPGRPQTIVLGLLQGQDFKRFQPLQEDEDGKWSYTFENLDAYASANDTEGIDWQVKELAVPSNYDSQVAETEGVANGFTITNTLKLSDAIQIEATKRITGRTFLEGDSFQIQLEKKGRWTSAPGSVGAELKTDSGTLEAMPAASSEKENVPSTVGLSSGQVKFGITPILSDLNIGEGTEKEAYFVYTLSEVQPEDKDGYAVTTDNDVNTFKGVTYSSDKYDVLVHVTTTDNGLNFEVNLTYGTDGKDGTAISGTPTFTNTYNATGSCYAHILKHINGRSFQTPTDTYEADKDDRFEFSITNVAGSPVRSKVGDPATLGTSVYVTPPMQLANANRPGDAAKEAYGQVIDNSTTGGTMAMLTGEGIFELSDLNADGEGIFIYEIDELEPGVDNAEDATLDTKVADLTYDKQVIYLRYTVKDARHDGTLDVTADYFYDAACTHPVKNAKGDEPTVWIDANTGLPLDETAAAAAEAGNTNNGAYQKVKAAYFQNTLVTEVPVTKMWVDENGGAAAPTDNVTIALWRYAVDMDEHGYPDKNATLPESVDAWEPVATHTFDRGDFYTAEFTVDGERKTLTQREAQELIGSDKITQGDFDNATWTLVADGSSTYTFQNVDVYPRDANGNLVSGKAYVLRVRESTRSYAYDTTYATVNAEGDVSNFSAANSTTLTEKGGFQVKNTTKAKNTANFSAAKQLTGRDWLSEDGIDRYTFTLTPVGRGTYYTAAEADRDAGKVEGDLKYDDQGQLVLDTDDPYNKVNMPTSHVSSELNEVEDANNKALAAKVTKFVDGTPDAEEVVGEGERLARFGTIEFDLQDLEYDADYGRMEGDFFYTIKEDLPTGGSAKSYKYKDASGTVQDRTGDGYNSLAEGETLLSVTWSDGITYDQTVHTVHVQVRENRTKDLDVQVAYDEKSPGKVETGTQFTPVFTNSYDTSTTSTVELHKYLLGREFQNGETFDFTMTAMAGAPFSDAKAATNAQASDDFPKRSDDGGTDADIEAALASGKAAHTKDGAHIIRLKVGDSKVTQGTDSASRTYQSIRFPEIVIPLSSLNRTVVVKDEKSYEDDGVTEFAYSGGETVPAGLKYGKFLYAIDEEAASDDTLAPDPDTEYAMITVIDKGDGTLDTSVVIYEDRYGTAKRYEPGTADNPASYVAFANKTTRDLEVVKNWVGPAMKDVTLQLQYATDDPSVEANWKPVEGDRLFAGINGIRTISGATGSATFEDLPTYLNILNDDLDLNDVWVYYRVVETDQPDSFTKRYGVYDSAKSNASEYSDTPLYTEAAGATPVTKLGAVNFSQASDSVALSAEKQLDGRDIVVAGDQLERLVGSSIVKRAATADDADDFKVKLEAITSGAPMPADTPSGATSKEVSVSRDASNHRLGSAALGSISYSLDNLAFDEASQKWKADFQYRISEVGPTATPDYPVTENTDGSKTWKGVTYSTDTYLATVHVEAVAGSSRLQTSVTYEREVSDGDNVAVDKPSFRNTYGSSVMTRGWVVKHINGRNWDATDNGKSDAFQFTITGIGGAAMHPDTSGLVDNVWSTPVMASGQTQAEAANVGADASTIDVQDRNGNNEVAMRTGKGLLTDEGLDDNGEAWFVYSVEEKPSVAYEKLPDSFNREADDLSYDSTVMYLRIHAKDNGDGTIAYVNEYFEDAGCTRPITSHVEYIDANEDLLPYADWNQAKGMSDEELADKEWKKVYTAYFTNSETLDVPVQKVWVGIPVEDVTVRLQRALFPLSDEADLDGSGTGQGDAFVEGKGESIWHLIGHAMTISRADFVNADGTPASAATGTRDESDGSTTAFTRTSETDAETGVSTVSMTYLNSNFNEALPMYVTGDGKTRPVGSNEPSDPSTTYRAVYRLVEDDTADAYDISYKSIQEQGREKADDQIFIDSGTMVVTNTTTATNKANIAAVKQLMNRDWLATDEFKFKLVPLGKADYYVEGDPIPQGKNVGDFKVNADGTVELVSESAATIPVPKEDDSRHSTLDEGTKTAYSSALSTTSEVGVGEHLARFGEIELGLSDLDYDAHDGHYQGDFFYRMVEDIPAGAKAYDDAGAEVAGVTFSEDIRGDYTWKKDGITYDAAVHTVHVKVRENRTEQLQITVSYDETDQTDPSTGTLFTPVYTNYYNAQAITTVEVGKHLVGRDWDAEDTFDFQLSPISGAPFAASDEAARVVIGSDRNSTYKFDLENKVRDDVNGRIVTEEEALAAGVPTIMADGSLRMRLKVTDASAAAQTGAFLPMKITAEDLKWTVGEGGAKDERDTTVAADATIPVDDEGTAASEGLKYGRFYYAIGEVRTSASDLTIDTRTVYAQVLAVDAGEGELYTRVSYYADRYGTTPCYVPDGNGNPSSTVAANAPFVDKLKEYAGVARVSVVKELAGRSWLPAYQAAVDDNPATDEDESKAAVGDAKLPAGDAFTFVLTRKTANAPCQVARAPIASPSPPARPMAS